MAKFNQKRVNRFGVMVTTLACAFGLAACGGGANAYDEYAAAYNKVSANGGIDADISAQVTMDGETNTYTGNFKVDNGSNTIYYEMSADGETTTQFSDGEYLYTERGDTKSKYALGGSQPSGVPSSQGDGQQPNKEAPEFDTTNFLNEFAGFLDAGKIKELGLLEPIAKAAVSETTKSGETYTLKVSDAIVQKFINTMAVDEAGTDDTVQISDMTNFNYKATESNGVIVSTSYSGDMTVNVPGSLMSDGNDEEYSLSFAIDVDFNNPGDAVSVTIPDDADSYTEVSGF